MSMMAAFLACAVALAVASRADWGVRGVWAALTVLIVTRRLLLGAVACASLARGGDSRDAGLSKPVRRHGDLLEPGAHNVAVRVRGTVVPSLARLGDDDVAARFTGVPDPCCEQGILAASAAVLGQSRGEAEIAHAFGDEYPRSCRG
jgi:hypothetical protein